MKTDQKKVVLVGAGLVGMSFAYALLNQNACDSLVLIDLNRERAQGEAMDLNHGLAFAGSPMKITAGDYNDCHDADIVAVCAGVAQKPGETRLDLLQRNTAVFQSVVSQVMASGFKGIFLVATNPVDVMARVTQRLSGLPASRVIGTGTLLDTARLRYMLGEYFGVDPRNVHAYVMGEHGDSEFVPWSQACVGTKSVLSLCGKEQYCMDDMQKISEDVRQAGPQIIAYKNATYYGIGMAMVRIVQAIFSDQNSLLTVSTLIDGVYGQREVYAGVPAVVGRGGVSRIIPLELTQEEVGKMTASCDILRSSFDGIRF